MTPHIFLGLGLEFQGIFIINFREFFLSLPRVKTIQPLRAGTPTDKKSKQFPGSIEHAAEKSSLSSARLLLLSDSLEADGFALKFGDIISECNASIVSYELNLDYSYWTIHDILDVLLPVGIDRISSFETVGHIGTFFSVILSAPESESRA